MAIVYDRYMKLYLPRFVTVAVFLLLFSSCSTFKKNKEAEEKPADRSPGGRSIPIGQVVLVNDSADFVLVKTGNSIRFKEGAELESRQGMTTTAILDFSPERKKGFMTADILQGQPQVGDWVYLKQPALPNADARQKYMEQRVEAQKSTQKSAGKARAKKRMRKK